VHDTRPTYQTRPTEVDGRQCYLSVLYLPRTFNQYANESCRVLPTHAYSSQMEAENHVALLALEQLHKYGFIDKDFRANIV